MTVITPEAAEAAASEYDKLLGDLEGFAKAMATDDAGEADDEGGDEKIEAAAAEAGATDGKKPDAAEGDESEEAFGKSFSITLADGSVQEAFDGSAMLKSLMLQNDGLRTRLSASEGVLTQQRAVNTALTENLTSLGQMVKSLQADVRKFGTTGTGRRSSVSVHEKAPVAGAPSGEPAGMKRGDVMAKSLSLMAEGKISGTDVARLESHVMGHNLPIPADLAHLFAG